LTTKKLTTKIGVELDMVVLLNILPMIDYAT